MEEYVVVLKKGIDKFQFSREMILPNGEGSIPAREVRITNHRIVSKQLVNYYLTEEEALELLNDERVESIAPQKKLDEIKPTLFATQRGTFERTADNDTIDKTKMSWGLSRCIHRSDPFNNSSTTDQVEDEYNYTLTGKGVDVIIVDSGVDMNHKEFQNADGTSRVVEYDWRQLYKLTNFEDSKRTVHYSDQEPDVNTLTELNVGDLWLDTTGYSDLGSFKAAYVTERDDGDGTYFDGLYIFDGSEWSQIISSEIPGRQDGKTSYVEARDFISELMVLIDTANNNPALPHIIDIYYQDEQPTENNPQDFWISGNDEVYRYTNEWIETGYNDKNTALYRFAYGLIRHMIYNGLDHEMQIDDDIDLWYGEQEPTTPVKNDLWYNGVDLYKPSFNYITGDFIQWSKHVQDFSNMDWPDNTFGSYLIDVLLPALPYIDISSGGNVFKFTFSNTAPSTPNDSDIWFDTTNFTPPSYNAFYNFINPNGGTTHEGLAGLLHYYDSATASWVVLKYPLRTLNVAAKSGGLPASDAEWAMHKYDTEGHGTACASSACGNTMGFARNAIIYSLNFRNPSIPVTDIYEILKKFHKNKPVDPKTGYKRPTVANFSWGYPAPGKGNTDISEIHYRGTTYTAAEHGTNGSFTWDQFNDFKIPEPYKVLFNAQNSRGTWPWNNQVHSVLCEELTDEGVHVVVAAGNNDLLMVEPDDADYDNYLKLKDGDPIGVDYSDEKNYGGKIYYNRKAAPYSEDMIIVGALSNTYKDEGGLNVEGKAGFSCYGSGIDVCAPGEAIICAQTNDNYILNDIDPGTPKINDDDNYRVAKFSGTSFAAPIVAGIVACLLEANPGMTPAQVKTWLRNNSTKDIMYDEGKEAIFANRDMFYGFLPERNSKSVGGGNRIVYMPFQRAKPLKLTKS